MKGGTYGVLVDDNFNDMDPDACWTAGEFVTADAAIAKCKSMVDEDLPLMAALLSGSSAWRELSS